MGVVNVNKSINFAPAAPETQKRGSATGAVDNNRTRRVLGTQGVVMNLNQITLPVSNMDAATEFYIKLGFTQIVDTPHYARFECPDGDATFSLSLEEGSFQNGAVIYFEHQELDNWASQLERKGIVFEHTAKDQNYLWREAVLYDPSGNKIKLFWAGENRRNPPWRVEKRA